VPLSYVQGTIRGEIRAYVQIRFWNSTSLIFKGVKSVGGLAESAVPDGGDCFGVK
jgi:hypothetical protein